MSVTDVLQEYRRESRLSWRQIAGKAGIQPMVLTRTIKHGQVMSKDNFRKLRDSLPLDLRKKLEQHYEKASSTKEGRWEALGIEQKRTFARMRTKKLYQITIQFLDVGVAVADRGMQNMRLRSDLIRGKRKNAKQMAVEDSIELGRSLALLGKAEGSLVVMGHCEILLQSRHPEAVPNVRWVVNLNDLSMARPKLKPSFEGWQDDTWCISSLKEFVPHLRGTRVGIGDLLHTVADAIRDEMSAVSLQMPSKKGEEKIVVDKALVREWHLLCRRSARRMRKGKITLREQRNISDEWLLFEQKLFHEEGLLEAKEKFLTMLHDHFRSLFAQFTRSSI